MNRDKGLELVYEETFSRRDLLVAPWMQDLPYIESQVRRLISVFVRQPRLDRNNTITVPNFRWNLTEGQPILEIEKRFLDRQIKKVFKKLEEEGVIEPATTLGGRGQSLEVQGWSLTETYRSAYKQEQY